MKEFGDGAENPDSWRDQTSQIPPALPEPPKKRNWKKIAGISVAAFLAIDIVLGLSGVLGSPSSTSNPVSASSATASSGSGTTSVPAPQVTDKTGTVCASLDSAGYCPGHDPAPASANATVPASAPQATDPAGNTCASLDTAGYCPGNDPAPAMTTSEQQAVMAAQQYLNMGSGFSAYSLAQQLTSSYGSGFSQADASFAIKYLNPDWNAQAVMAAKGYMNMGGFSRSGLIQQLTSDYGNGFTQAQAEYAVSQVGL